MAIHSSILAWEIPWTEKTGGLQFIGSQRVGHHRATNTFTFFGELRSPKQQGNKDCVPRLEEPKHQQRRAYNKGTCMLHLRPNTVKQINKYL